jgi:hypothetical protein
MSICCIQKSFLEKIIPQTLLFDGSYSYHLNLFQIHLKLQIFHTVNLIIEVVNFQEIHFLHLHIWNN